MPKIHRICIDSFLSLQLTELECSVSMRTTSLPQGCTHEGNGEIETAYCNLRTCDGCDAGPGSVCCCRAIATSFVDGIECAGDISPPSVPNVTFCGCTVCDDITVTVSMKVLNRDTLEEVRAAQVYRVDDGDELRPIGITDNSGRLIFIETAATRSVTLTILAADFIQYRSLPILLDPSRRMVSLEVKLIPIMSIQAGLGGSAITLRLGPTAVISAPAGAFRMSDGGAYEDMLTFRGMVMSSSDENEFTGLPSSNFMAYDSETGNITPFGAILATFVEFFGVDGEKVLSEDLRLAVSISGTGETVPDLFLAVYNESTGQWTKHSLFEPLPQFRKKRQQTLPLVVEAPDIPQGVFTVVALSEGAECWVQGRVFNADNSSLTGPYISVEERVNISGNPALFRFGTNTGSLVNAATYFENALCLPLHCSDILSATITSRVNLDLTSDRLLPVEFPEETFDITEPAPILIGTTFFFDELVNASQTEPKPFYDNFQSCQANALETNDNADRSDYFRFVQVDIDEPVLSDTCFVKVQISDCFEGNVVTVTSINPDNGGIADTRSFFVTDPVEEVTTDFITTVETTTMSGDGPTDITTTEFMDTTTEFVCDANTATQRIECLPFLCGHVIQLIVRPAESRGVSGLCTATNQAVLLPFISDPPVQDAPFVIRTESLITNDYNQPELGLYHDEGNSPAASLAAREMCNFGGMGRADNSSITDNGIAVYFSCVE